MTKKQITRILANAIYRIRRKYKMPVTQFNKWISPTRKNKLALCIREGLIKPSETTSMLWQMMCWYPRTPKQILKGILK